MIILAGWLVGLLVGWLLNLRHVNSYWFIIVKMTSALVLKSFWQLWSPIINRTKLYFHNNFKQVKTLNLDIISTNVLIFVYTQPHHQQGQFLAEYSWFELIVFLLLNWLLYYLPEGNWWIHVFHIAIGIKWNADNLVKDLNLCRR